MSEPIELHFGNSFDVVEADFLTDEINEIKFVKNFWGTKCKKVTVLSEYEINIACPAEVCQLGVGLIRGNNKFDVIFFEFDNEVVGHIGADIDGFGHFFVALFISSVQ
jgi:hypothetical protein